MIKTVRMLAPPAEQYYGITGWHAVGEDGSPLADELKELSIHMVHWLPHESLHGFYNYTGGIYSHVSGIYEGLHAVELIGYDDSRQCFFAKNSWATEWARPDCSESLTAKSRVR